MKKRLASTLLALALCLSLLPTAALAEEGTQKWEGWTQLTDATTSMSGGNYYLAGDVTISQSITVSGTVTLDLNGNTLASNSNNYAIEINNGGNLTITDSDSSNGGTIANVTATGGGCVYVKECGSLTMNDGTIAENTILKTDPDSTFHMTGNAINKGTLIINNAKFTMNGNAESTSMIQVTGQTSDFEPVTICENAKVTGTIQIDQPQENAAGFKLKDHAYVNTMCGLESGAATTIEMQDNAVIDKVENLSFRNPQLSGNAKLGSKDSTFTIIIPNIEGDTEHKDFTIQDHVQLYGKVTIVLADPEKKFVLGGNASITGAVTVSNGPNAKMIMMDESVIYGDVTCTGKDISFEIQDNAKINGKISSDSTSGNVGTINLVVKFDLNGGDLPAETENSPYAAQTVSLNGKITQPAAPTKSGYRFSGWYYNGNAWNFEEGVTAPMILTAQWSRKSSGGSPSYAVTAAETKHGAVALSAQSAKRGSTVTVTVTPDSGYVLESLAVVDGSGNEQKLTDLGEGRYTFTMPSGKVEVKATFQEDNSVLNVFYDVPNDAYYFEAVKWAVGKNITNGVSENLFGPDQACTRAQIVTFLWRAAGSPVVNYAMDLTDVPADAYYAEAVRWALSEGITTGTGEGTFSPDAACTRAQAVTFLARALDGKTEGAANFQDVLAGSYYAEAVAWAVETGVTNGISETLFGPDQACTRGQIVTFLFRADAGK